MSVETGERKGEQLLNDFFQERLPDGYRIVSAGNADYDFGEFFLQRHNLDSTMSAVFSRVGLGDYFGWEHQGLVKAYPGCRISLSEELSPEEQAEIINGFLGELTQVYANESKRDVYLEFQQREELEGNMVIKEAEIIYLPSYHE